MKTIKNALISVFYKDNLDAVVKKLHEQGVIIYSTGGTQNFIEKLDIPVKSVENLTSYPSILGGRVKTLHPKVFGGILSRREEQGDLLQLEEYDIPEFDLVIVDLYPFEETVTSGAAEQDTIEKIDIGGISLIRAGAKNFKDVMIVSSRNQYADLLAILTKNNGTTTLEERKIFAREAFNVSSHYDTHIYNYFLGTDTGAFKQSKLNAKALRYGENPHQKALFYGDIEQIFDQLHGKEISYNNLLDIDAAINLMHDFKDDQPTFAILKHNNACGIATRSNLANAYSDALAGDPTSAFGGILIANVAIDEVTATKINKLFCEVVITPDFDAEALSILKQKKNRVLLKLKSFNFPKKQFRTVLNGVLEQDKDLKTEVSSDLKPCTEKTPTEREITDLLFANKLVKHTKSNTIVLVKNNQLLASGTGQTSRVDALQQAIEKAKRFNFDLSGAVMASDAFFPFPDCVEIAHLEGIDTVVQPGGSIKDKESVAYCDKNNMAMVITGNRHFKH